MKKCLWKIGYREHKFDTGKSKINVVVGPPNGTPLVLIPGQTMPWESYTRVLPALSRHFEVYAVDVPGHGRSDWTPGAYTFNQIGRDLAAMLEQWPGRPVIISGNSSGGILSAWLAANAPKWVLGVIPEDPPFFSCEWPRLRDDTYIYHVMKMVVEALTCESGRDLASFFARFEVPVEGNKRVMTMPRGLSLFISLVLRTYQSLYPGRPVDLPFLPLDARLFIRGLSEYDPAFTAAFLDGSPGEGFDHAETLSRIECPMLLMHAHWFRHPKYGLVGALDDSDVERVRSLVSDFRYLKVESGHIIHLHQPETFVREIVRFAREL